MNNIYENVRNLDKKRCQVWGCGENNIEVHHIIPRSLGGATKEWNLICLCGEHHRKVQGDKLYMIDILLKIKRRRNYRWQKVVNLLKEKYERQNSNQ